MTKTTKLNSPVKHTKEVHSPIRWFGGKHYLAKDIIPLMPKHHCYVEPFAGGGHVLTQKEKSKVEVWNDIDASLINFLMTLRGRKEELTQALETLPTSRFLTELWLKEPMPEDSFEKAVRWYYLLRQTIVPTNNQKSGWRAGKIKNTAFDFQNSVQRLNDFEKRIRGVMIECLDFRELIRKYDSPQTFFFIDPPYVGREGFYKGGFSASDHRELAELLRNIKGKALVSYYPDPLVNELYKGWRTSTVDTLVGTGVRKAEKGQRKKLETEIFFMNYDENHEKIQFMEEVDLSFVGYDSKQLSLF
ncbi:DNA adenine methylase [Bacillus cereus]|uniref:DNA adenine methylase n=1 Tax=Bacillus cereus TaxID=1396 RepID=UPI000B4C0E55|nr:DNA adenine methylase [Bacillus cereus]